MLICPPSALLNMPIVIRDPFLGIKDPRIHLVQHPILRYVALFTNDAMPNKLVKYLTILPVPARSLHNPRSPALPQRLIFFTTHRSKAPGRSHRLKWSMGRAFIRLLRKRRRICYRHSMSVTQLMEFSLRRAVTGVRPTQIPS